MAPLQEDSVEAAAPFSPLNIPVPNGGKNQQPQCEVLNRDTIAMNLASGKRGHLEGLPTTLYYLTPLQNLIPFA
jgi:hypothetical protein